MTPTSVLTTHALIAIGFAIPLLFAPGDFLWRYGAEPDLDARYLARMFGAALAGVSAITWLAREAPEGPALDAICFGLAVASGVAFLVALIHQLTAPTAAPLGWSTVAVCAGLAAAYVQLWLGREARRSAHRVQPG